MSGTVDDVSIVSGNLRISGWQNVMIRMGIEVMPSTFELRVTEFDPLTVTDVTVHEGAGCQVYIGEDVVITGYVDRVERSFAPGDHEIVITGRSKSADLVDCSAIFSTYQVNNTNPLSLANKLTAPFGIKAVAPTDIGTVQIPQFDVILSETPYEIIERVCRFACLLCYDDNTGNIILTQAGSELAASGFAQGVNVEAASVLLTMDERYSTISAVLQTTDTMFLTPGDDNLSGQLESVTVATKTDSGVPRYRPLIIPAEQGDATITTSSGEVVDYPVTHQRVQWEINRRAGRSQVARVTCDSWRDTDGVLWGPNTLAPISLPKLKLQPKDRWLISEVTFRRDEDGTHADVVLMPKGAFAPEPIVLQPLASDVSQALNQSSSNTAASGIGS